MSTDEPRDEAQESAEPEAATTEVRMAYAGRQHAGRDRRDRPTRAGRQPPPRPGRFEATIKEPLRFREAMAALYAVVASDFRYVPKDRTAYLAYTRMRRESSGPECLAGPAEPISPGCCATIRPPS